MRSDMAKVMVERPRGGWLRQSRPKGYRRYTQQASADNLPAREPMLGCWNGGTKHFSEHLGPLCRYLHSQVGRPWNKVHSDICRHIRADSVVQNHVLTHVWGYVTLHVILKDRVPCHADRYPYGQPIQPGGLYVCPRSGLLQRAKRRHPRLETRRNSRFHDVQYHLIDGIWLEVRLRKLPLDFADCWDALLRRRIGTMRSGELWKTYGAAVYAISTRPLSRAEVRALKLNSPAPR